MDIQLLTVILIFLAAIVFLGSKFFSKLRKKNESSCANCHPDSGPEQSALKK